MKEKLNELYFRSLVDSEREEAPTPRAHDLRKLKAEAKGLSFHYGDVSAQAAFLENAAAAGIVLIVMTLVMNGLAIWLRFRFRKRIKW